LGFEFGVKVGNMARDNGLCVCVVKRHGVSDEPLGEAITRPPRSMCRGLIAVRLKA
jgi:hypothetical protein